MVMIREHEPVVLLHDIPEHRLLRDDIGTVAHVYPDDGTYEVEFVQANGRTVALLTLTRNDIRPMESDDVLRVRRR